MNIGLPLQDVTGGGTDCADLDTGTLSALGNQFAASCNECAVEHRKQLWERAVTTLESDPFFEVAEVSKILVWDSEKISSFFQGRLSSGHRIVLLTISRLVEKVEEKTLVLIDEPEVHLHPPLLSAFIRALSDLMLSQNGVAIIATHSPVVLQEVPRNCVWRLERSCRTVVALRPERETFGENLGALTRDVFGYEVTDSGFHKMIHRAVEEHQDFESAVNSFGGNLGGEARAILRGLFALKMSGSASKSE